MCKYYKRKTCDDAFPDSVKIAKVVINFITSAYCEFPLIFQTNIPVKQIWKSAVRRTELLFYPKQLEQQYSFGNNHSTSLSITHLYENLLQSIDKNITCAVFSIRSNKRLWFQWISPYCWQTLAVCRKRKLVI